MSFPNYFEDPEFYQRVKIGSVPILAALVEIDGIKMLPTAQVSPLLVDKQQPCTLFSPTSLRWLKPKYSKVAALAMWC